MNRAVFIDKDGTLIHDVPYNVNPSHIRFYPDVTKSLKLLKRLGYLLIMVSNQSGIAKGLFTEWDLEKVADEIQKSLLNEDAQFDAFYFCPHHPCGNVDKYKVRCNCRKPEPGMLLQAAEEFNIDLKHSWMIGDILNDVEAGNRAGCRTVLIDNGNETEWETGNYRKPHYIVHSLYEAATIIKVSNFKVLPSDSSHKRFSFPCVNDSNDEKPLHSSRSEILKFKM